MTKLQKIQGILGVDYKIIRLSSGHECSVDSEDYDSLSAHKWHRDGNGYAYRHNFVDGKDSPVRMHRQIMKDCKSLIDHINRDPLDNRKCNLRPCTQQQNLWNAGKKSTNTSGYIGVDFSKEKKRFRARIRTATGRINLGYFDSPKEASLAYEEAKLIHHGGF